MKRFEMIKKDTDFRNIIHHAKFKKNKYYVVYNQESTYPYPKFGIAVGKKLGNAVTRNKIKRQIRMIITNNKNVFKKNTYYIIMIKRNVLDLKYAQMELNLLDLLKGE